MLVLTIFTCFLNIMMPPKPRATCKLGGMGLRAIMKQTPRQGPYLQGNDLSWLTQRGHPEAEAQTLSGSLDGVADLKAALVNGEWESGERRRA